MNEFKGTRGPWEKDGVEIRGVSQHQSECICVMQPGFEHEDARLIAAAPDLLEALQGLLAQLENNLGAQEDTRAAYQAIAKALGVRKP